MIIDLQRRIVEAGRIRTGLQEAFERPDGSTGSRPAKLDTFRFTSADQRRIEQLAALYGGTVEAWEAPAGPQWQVVSERSEIDVIVPPSDLSFSQHYELWSAGGCKRRCDGVTESISEGPCLCNPEDRECDIHSRLSVMLRDIPGLGVWRLDTQGWYAAQELIGAVEVIAIAAGRGALLPARLRLDQRMVKRPDKKGKVVTRRFAVPVIDIEISPGQLLAGGQGVPLAVESGDERRPPLTPVPALAAPVPSIAEQSAPPGERPKRSNAAAEIPSSGRRRSASQPSPEPAAEVVPDGPPPISNKDFRQAIADADIDLAHAAAIHKRRFPTGPSTKDMTDDQRGRLWAEIQETKPEEPAAVEQAAGSGLTLAALTQALQANRIAFAFAEGKALEVFGDKQLDKLTDAQRATLAAALDITTEEEEPDASES